MPISAIDTIALAVQHTKQQLFQPFRLWQWTRLALVGLLAGEIGSSGSFHFPSNFNFPQTNGPSRHFMEQSFPKIDPAILGGLVAVLVIAGGIFLIVLMYISSVMRFILFDSIVTKECHIRQGWAHRQGPAWRYFLWQLGFMLAVIAAAVVFLGIPAGFAYSMGWFSQPGEHVLGLVLGGIVMLFVAFVFFVGIAVVHVLTKDFVVPQMALEGIGAIEGWRRLWKIMEAEKGGYAGYIGMKIVMAIGAGIMVAIATVILGLMIVIPSAALAIVAVLTGKSAGLTWNAFTITVMVVAACILFAIFMYLVALISVPVIVFFPAYSIYFFAPRYRALGLVVYPPPAAGPEEPPMPLMPAPIG
ncbi:MAG: hypothetical protein DMG79_20825 [Acidobacteria bacterium]|nr:MAG: hypothetical protein DMG79_20825 [Acidobacteriota bacterium]